MTAGIYQITNTATGKAYVGSAASFRARFATHRHGLRTGTHHSSKLQHAWDKYGETAFVFEKLLICTPEMLTYYEQRALDALKPAYNILPVARSSLGFRHSTETRATLSVIAATRVPRKGFHLSEETKQKISTANTGRVPSAETIEKLRKARVGKTPAKGLVHTPEAKAAMSKVRRGTKRSPKAVEAGAAKLRGVPRSAETKAKLSLAMTGRKRTPEANAKISLALTGRKRAPETIAKMLATRAANRANLTRKAQPNG